MSDTNYSNFLDFLTRLSNGEIAEFLSPSSGALYQYRWQDGYIEWRRADIPESNWIRDSAEADFHVRVSNEYPITWLRQSPFPQSERSNIRRVEL